MDLPRPASPDPQPATCQGRENLERAGGTWQGLGLPAELEELQAKCDSVLVILRAPGRDKVRARHAEDRNFHVATVHDGAIVALRACRAEPRRVRSLD